MEREERRIAKAQMIAGMIHGRPWHEAAAAAGVHTSRTAAYRLLRAVHLRGEGALQDGRHGHPAKLRGPVREWLAAFCRGSPALSSREVQAALQERFGVSVSSSQISRVRHILGVGSRSPGVGGKSGPTADH